MHVPQELRDALATRYEIEDELGHGGMAVVYLARDLTYKRRVALKVLDRGLAVEREDFQNEIKLLAGLVAPHIVSVFEAGEAAGSLFYSMEYVEGETLAQRIRVGPLPVDEVARIGCEVADALVEAHKNGVIHRDIKPGNILLKADHAWVADFGIAKAMAGDASITASGFLVGTPLYMSPEQASSGAVLDGRTDIYSLGCVLYEALTGQPPFMGDTPQDVLAKHLTDPVPSVRRLRRDIPPGLARVITRALAKRPEDRFASAAVMLEALKVGDVPATPVRDAVRWMQDHWLPVGATAAVAAGIAVWLVGRVPELDPDRYAIVPFAHRGGAAPSMITGDRCESLLSQSFGRWNDLKLVDPILVRDWLLRHRGEITFDVARRLARALGAGKLVWGDVTEPDDSITVNATIYDLQHSDRAVESHSVRIDHPQTTLHRRFKELADTLLLGRAAPAALAAPATSSYRAWLSYADGDAALQRWELDSAARAFGVALELDPTFPYAHLWLAHAQSWGGQPVSTWRSHAEAAVANAARLSRRDSALAGALLAQSQGNYAQSCADYQRLLARDSTRFAEWFGLGDCLSRDSAVVRDPASPSGWRFRTSYHTAARAYGRALRMVPSMHLAFRGARFDALLSRLRRVLLTETRFVRFGQGPELGASFAAYPAIIDDTLAFVPYLRADVFAGRTSTRLPTHWEAVRRARDDLRAIVMRWLDAYDQSPDVYEALALVLEMNGDIPEARPPERSALLMVRRARRLARQPLQQVRLAVAEARLLVKLDRFVDAVRLAEVELRRQDPGPAEAAVLAGLAALTGQAHRAAGLLFTAASSGPFDPLPLASRAAALQAYAAIGQPVDSITRMAARLDRDIEVLVVQPERRGGVRDTLLTHIAIWAWPTLRAPPVSGRRIVEMQRAAQRNDTVAVLRLFADLRALRRGMAPGEIAIDRILQEARVLFAVGESREAAQLLDESLGALETHGTGLVRVEQAAALGRAMELRIRLALDVGDTVTARRWAVPVAELWRDADIPALRAVAESMRGVIRRTDE